MAYSLRKKEKKQSIRSSTAGNILISAGIIVFFVAIILFYYYLLYNEKRDSIIMHGQMSAMDTTGKVVDYLDTAVEVVKLSSYNLDKMVRDGRTAGEILNYLTTQTTAVKSTIFEDTTGMYAYIRGKRYLDGAGWEPEEGWDPTTRPWYKEAMKNKGEIAIVEPYLDAQTNTIMMSICKMLSDGESVVSFDISQDEIQRITEEAVLNGNSDYELILDKNNLVIAHSDKNEVGKNYNDEEDSFWAEILKEAGDKKDHVLEVNYEGSQYIVYILNVRDNWRCLTINEATSTFRPLFFLVIMTIAVVIIIVIILSFIMYNSNRRFVVADKLNKQLSSIADTFYYLFDIDFMNDSFGVIKSSLKLKTETPDRELSRAKDSLVQVTEQVASNISKPDMMEFIQFETLNERLKNQDTVAEEFLSNKNVWCRARFVVSKRNPDGTINHVLWIVEGIDEEKRRRDQLIDLSERAFAASKAKSAFLSNMSHEIRTPINAVLGMNEVILRESSEQNIIEYSESIRNSGNTLLNLINDILDFSKIESGKIDIINIDYDLSSTIDDLVNMIQNRVESKRLEMRLDINSEIPRFLNGDEVRIKQIITNILTNAVKYTDNGSITLGIDFKDIPDEPESIMLNVAVSDTGIGIKDEDMNRLFSEYERIEEKRNRNVEGTGLGLSITKSLLEMMGSSLMVESEYGVGSKFYFSVKQTVVKRTALGDYQFSFEDMHREHKKYSESFIAPDARVLIVDDNTMNLTVFTHLLKKTKVMIDTAESGDEGIRMTHNMKYDVIFLDHMMPQKDGIETLHELKSEKDNPNSCVPFICLTANAVSGAREQYMKEGFDDYLTKPVEPAELEKMLMEYLPVEKILDPSGEDGDASMPESHKEYDRVPEVLSPVQGISEIDIRAGLANNGSADVYLTILGIFYDSLEEKVRELEGLLNSGNYEEYTIKVHAIKSSLKLIGAVSAGNLAQELENAGKGNDTAFIHEHNRGFTEDLYALKNSLSPVFVKEAGPEYPMANPVLISVMLEEIYSAAEDGDEQRLSEAMKEVSLYRVPDDMAGAWDEIKKAAASFDHDRLKEIIEKMSDQKEKPE